MATSHSKSGTLPPFNLPTIHTTRRHKGKAGTHPFLRHTMSKLYQNSKEAGKPTPLKKSLPGLLPSFPDARHACIFFSLSHSFASRIFIAWGTRINLCIRMTQRIESSFGNVIVMIFVSSLCRALSGQLVSFTFVCVHCSAFCVSVLRISPCQ